MTRGYADCGDYEKTEVPKLQTRDSSNLEIQQNPIPSHVPSKAATVASIKVFNLNQVTREMVHTNL